MALRRVFSFVYEAEDAATQLTEREFDHVLVGRLDAEPVPAPGEVADLAWREPAEVLRDVRERPERYTPWFRMTLARLEERGLLGAPSHEAASSPG